LNTDTKPRTDPAEEQEPAVYEIDQFIDGKYEVRKLMPPGGAGQVYAAYDDVFERMCAVKIFNNSGISEDSFKTEARLLLNLHHPSIVQVYDWGVLKKSKRFYLTSEFVDGDELTKYANPGNLLPLPEVIQVILDLLSALEYLHPNTERLDELRDKMRKGAVDEAEYEEYSGLREQGLFHRDIKPSNLVLSPTGVKLIDFNIASRAVTVGQTFSGTVGYMLPEIGFMPWSSDGDLFATGIVLYELVTGYHPYPNRRPMSDETPADPLQYVPNLGPELADIMKKAVSCDPETRYHSARRFKQNLLKASEQLA
jgi:serine/threonine protein kinase